MTLEQQMRAHPWTWKDTLASITVTLTIATVVLQGGRILERLDATNEKLVHMSGQLTVLQTDQVRLERAVTQQQGIDALHAAQLRHLDEAVRELKAADAARRGR